MWKISLEINYCEREQKISHIKEKSEMEFQGSGRKKSGHIQQREKLMKEGLSGKTIRDTLPNTSFPWTEEAEAMYFKGARVFLGTSLAHSILCGHQDVVNRIEV